MTLSYLYCKACRIWVKIGRLLESAECPMCGQTIKQGGNDHDTIEKSIQRGN